MTIKNIIFDVGNVLVRWDPHYIVSQSFPEREDHAALAQAIFKHPTWFNHNLGMTSEGDIIDEYHQRLNIEKAHLKQMMIVVKESLVPIEGSFELLKSLYDAKFNLYALTDNTIEIMAFLKQKYDFWQYFKGIVVSAEIGYLKPSSHIFQHLLESYHLKPQETVFIDDYLVNVEGAKNVGIEAICFKNSQQCLAELKQLQITF